MPADKSWNSPVSVLIVESNQLNCQLIQNVFSRGRQRIVVAGATVDTDQALAILKERQPDVAIVSPRLVSGPAGGFALVRNIQFLKLRTRAIMLLDSREREAVVDAFRFGAHGVVFRDEPLKILTKCIYAVCGGQFWVNSLNLGYLIDALKQSMPLETRDFSASERLTKRERDIASLIAEGMTNRDIAHRLGLTENTVRNYLQHVFDKVGRSSRAELMLYWIQRSQHMSMVRPTERGAVAADD